MIKNILNVVFYVLLCMAILIAVYFLYIVYNQSKTTDCLEKAYYIGGIISGIFAFGAFFVAIIANYKQNKTGNLQRFETTFFNMLNQQQQIANNLVYYKDDENENSNDIKKTVQGKELFRYFWESISLKSISDGNTENQMELDIGDNTADLFLSGNGLKELLHKFGQNEYEYQKVTTYFDHYFRHLYTIIKFVHNTYFLKKKEKYKYTSIVRATLSRYELVWIYYNCLSDVGREKFKKLVETYSLLKNMRENLLSLCKENNDMIVAKDLNVNNLKDKEFSGTDYEFFLSTEKNSNNKYYIGAFYNRGELDKGREVVRKWQDFWECPQFCVNDNFEFGI